MSPVLQGVDRQCGLVDKLLSLCRVQYLLVCPPVTKSSFIPTVLHKFTESLWCGVTRRLTSAFIILCLRHPTAERHEPESFDLQSSCWSLVISDVGMQTTCLCWNHNMTLRCVVNWLRLHGCWLLGLPSALRMVVNLVCRATPRFLHDCKIKP